ncbi:hypothetical protein [Scytonema sp. NUACC26]|uniref:hypothetical protein n=1 Tax=Scytonema sp. NUACC26 TaxID=3140176 RepID=UPI0038B25598
MQNALLLYQNFDNIQIKEIMDATCEIRKDPEVRNREEVETDWAAFRESDALEDQVKVNGQVTTINELMAFE